MHFRSLAALAALATALAVAPNAQAQTGAESRTGAPRIPNRAQTEAVAKKLATDGRFKASLNAGSADDVRNMMLADGASPKLRIAVQTLTFNSSPRGSFDVIGGGGNTQWCVEWGWHWVWTHNTWNFEWFCVGIGFKNPIIYTQ